MLGCDGGDRWQQLAKLWAGRATGGLSPFNDIHAAMTALRTGDRPAFEALEAAMRRTVGDGGELAAAYGAIGLPVVQALAGSQSGGLRPNRRASSAGAI